MKAVILCAGQGKRLLELTAETPKVLLTVQGKTILEWSLDNVIANGIKDIALVVGFQEEKIVKKIGNEYKGAKITYISNPLYNFTNNLFSVWLCHEFGKDGFILINGDDLYDKQLITDLIKSEYKDAAVVDLSKTDLPEDAMKATITNNKLTEVSKVIPRERISGDAMGIYKFSKEGAAAFFKTLKTFLTNGQHTTWYLAALNNMVKTYDFYIVPTNGHFWCEVDDVVDYNAAQEKMAAYLKTKK